MKGLIDCTVVIPVYNRGEALEAGIESLRAQSLGAERIEIIYVDDGSDDGRTPAMLDQIVAETPNARVFHEPPSGSPGRPRNVGLANAQGEYVFFADHDDWFDSQALERLVGLARQHRSDVVIGKVVGHGRRIQIPHVFRESRAAIPAVEAMISLTPHKLFRRAFLLEHDIRNPEGRRRLEDHYFVTHAYLHARTISVYADRVCYHHNSPGAGENFSQVPADPDVYIDSNREVIELIRRHTIEDPTRRDALMQRPVVHELLKKAGPRQLHQVTPEAQARKHQGLRAALVEAVPPSVVEGLGAFPRAIAKALRDDDADAVRRLDSLSTALALDAQLVALGVDQSVWTVDLRVGLAHDGVPVRFRQADKDAWLIDETVLPTELADRPERVGQLLDVDLEVLIASRRTDVQWHLPANSTVELQPAGGGRFRRRPETAELRITGTASIDLSEIGGEQIGFGLWDVVLRADVLGVGLGTRLTVSDESALPRSPATTRLRSPHAVAWPKITPKQTFVVEVRRGKAKPSR
jgi:hypothetical protein